MKLTDRHGELKESKTEIHVTTIETHIVGYMEYVIRHIIHLSPMVDREFTSLKPNNENTQI